jgi:DNA-binding NarL/FixJ family response regulator
MIRTAIVEDDPAAIERLTAAIAAAADVDIAWIANNVETARPLIDAGGFDVLLCDLGLPDGDGVKLIKQAATKDPTTDIIVVTIFANQSKVLDSIKAGARGYLLKDDKLDDCVMSIRQIREGGSPISPIIARQLLRQLTPQRGADQIALEENLSDREVEVLNMLARGFAYSEIAKLLSLSQQTIPTYVKRIYRKLEVHSRSEAVYEAANRGIIDVH